MFGNDKISINYRWVNNGLKWRIIMEKLTVVYTINNKKSFETMLNTITENVGTSEGKDWAVTAMSKGDEISKLSDIMELINDETIDIFEKVDFISDIIDGVK